ncbi:hypothetical protein CPT_Shaeky_049 [Streptomyces phage Shaeky]|uniref:Uncharacterized protein n=1 Tax=Streptomyces phage Shaeky TaxID=2767586 RepID=A0A873WJR0_9CAUD|nr:hypothetical protein CPT_Shaeky_049 [Streptomyces phage Shaeky]
MLTPNRIEIGHTDREGFALGNRDDAEFWTRQILLFPEDFVTVELPERGEYVTFEVEDGRVSTVLVTSGWPQLSGCPASW